MALQFALLAAVALAGLLTGGAWDGTLAAISGLIGLALMIAGAALSGRGLMDLGQNLTPLPYPREDARLVESGVYAWVRHPMYSGLAGTAVGWGLVSASPLALILAGAVVVFFDLKARREEAWLVQRYPDYRGYMARSRRLIPWVY